MSKLISKTNFYPKIPVIAWLILLGYFGLILAGVKTFTVWSQIDYQYNVDSGLIEGTQPGIDKGVHTPRYWLMLPLLKLSELTGWSAGGLFGIAVLFMAAISWRLIVDVAKGAKNTDSNFLPEMGVLFAVLALISFMNGRMVFAFFSISLLLYIESRIRENNYWSGAMMVCLYFFAAWCASVSSGSFLAFTILSVVWLSISVPKPFRGTIYYKYMLAIFFGSLILLTFMVVKVLYFFGGGIQALSGIVHHGIGNNIWLLLIAALIIPVIALRIYSIRNHRLFFTGLVVVVGIMCGIAGYSSLVVSIPALLVLAQMSYVNRKTLSWR